LPPFLGLDWPDENNCVWLVSGRARTSVVVTLAPREAVAEKLAQWLTEIYFGE
jgi:hypothetical protein